MPVTISQPRAPRTRVRAVRVTGRKLAATAPMVVQRAYRLDPRDGVRAIVAMLSSGQDA